MRNRLPQLRRERHLSQEKLATMLGVSRQTIISIEKEQYKPSLMLAYRMAQIFRTTVEDLCCLEENKRKEDEAYEKL